MTIHNWVVILIAAVFGLPCLVSNWGGVFRYFIKKKPNSNIPFIGGISLAICISQTPLRAWWWCGLLLDVGFISGVLGLAHLLLNVVKKEDKKE